jgi:orotate phosphoribosyltransferase
MYGYYLEQVIELANKILDLCQKENIGVVSGPVSSGVVIATACFVQSQYHEHKIKALLLGKPGYRREKHPNYPKILGSYDHENVRTLIVDDTIATGAAMKEAIIEIEKRSSKHKVIGVATPWCDRSNYHTLREFRPNIRFWDLAPSKPREYTK